MSNIAIYTCITGDYELPTDGFDKRPGYDYYCFCDKVIPVHSWKLIIPKFKPDDNLSDVKKQRMVKTHPFWVIPEEYDVAVWIDANTHINDKLYNYIERYKDNPITFKKHPDRDCIYEEIKECVLWEKETVNNGQFLYHYYLKFKYPKHHGLFETNIIISHPKDPTVIRLYDAWWEQIYNFSHRDQLSLNYILWKNNLDDFVTSVDCLDFPPLPHIPISIQK